MKKTFKAYYRKALADRRRKEKLNPRFVIRPSEVIDDLYLLDRQINDDFCKKTILPYIAQKDDRVPLEKTLCFDVPIQMLMGNAYQLRDKMLRYFAEEVEHSLGEILSKSVSYFNCGHYAGGHSPSFDLGTEKQPIKISKGNVFEKCNDIILCNLDADAKPRLSNKVILLLPTFMGHEALDASMSRPIVSASALCKDIRYETSAIGKLFGCETFIAEAITRYNTAYSIRPDTVRWNFKFKYEDYFPRYELSRVVLRYGFCIANPAHIVKMEVC